MTTAPQVLSIAQLSDMLVEVPENGRALIQTWLDRGDGVAVYQNQALDSSGMGHHQYTSYGSANAMLVGDEPPQRMPDMGGRINWKYQLEAVCRPGPDESRELPALPPKRYRTTPLYRELASMVDAYQTCAKRGNVEWENIWPDRIKAFLAEHLPRVPGQIDFDYGSNKKTSHADRLVFRVAYHDPDDDSVSYHDAIATPSFIGGVSLSVLLSKGERMLPREISDDIHEMLLHVLLKDIQVELPPVPETGVPEVLRG